MSSPFHRRRAKLQGLGLIDDSYRLTEAGNAYVDQLLDQLKRTRVENDASGPRVRWDSRR